MITPDYPRRQWERQKQWESQKREQQELAAAYDCAAEVLEAVEGEHREATNLLYSEATRIRAALKQWRER